MKPSGSNTAKDFNQAKARARTATSLQQSLFGNSPDGHLRRQSCTCFQFQSTLNTVLLLNFQEIRKQTQSHEKSWLRFEI